MRAPGAWPAGCLLAAAAATILTGCSSSADNEGGGPLPHQLDGETYPGARTQVAGDVVQAQNGCLYVSVDGIRRFAVWPRGAGQDPQDGRVVLLEDGTRIRPGDRVTAAAAIFPVSGLVGVPDGYWGGQVAFCAPDDDQVLVLDRVTVSGAD